METIRTVAEMERRSRELRESGTVLGLLPTMGAPQEGHLSLVREAADRADTVVVSIFVNPTQFGPSEDFDSYPRSLERDAALVDDAGCDILFVPEAADVYPSHYSTVVHVQHLTCRLCGAFRPGHFDGVTTVVAKLLNVVRPHFAVFGQKDGQQLAVIARMTADLNMGVEIVRGETVREPDGLAMSSRNIYLSSSERRDATALFESLELARGMYESGETDAALVLAKARALIEERASTEVQYVEAVDVTTLEPVSQLRDGVMIMLAVFVGKTRLIDNVVL
ncbi:pantoate--beta-alanine ligase [bacterium]|nr:pantoate--beta-alanine ligase [bacterium]